MDYMVLKEKINRRKFLEKSFKFALGLGLSPMLLDILLKTKVSANSTIPFVHEAMFYDKLGSNTVQCKLCARRCVLKDGQRSFCRAREPKDGKLYSLVYGLPCAVHIDPIEKKPLFHFLPSSFAFSVATAGCNYRCKYCQNWQISQFPPEETSNYSLPPEEIVSRSVKNKCPTIAYTYSEPSIFYEYMLDTAKIAKKYGLRNMYHSNGSLNQEPVSELGFYLDAANIDLKGFTQDFYMEISAGYLDTVLAALKILKSRGVWLEITNLMLPTINDDPGLIRKMCLWIKDNLGDSVPLHFSRFWPQYKLNNLYPTPVSTLENARDIAMSSGLKFVYIGNVPGHPAENTYCPNDKKVLIRRRGFMVLENNFTEEGKCKYCHYTIAGVWR